MTSEENHLWHLIQCAKSRHSVCVYIYISIYIILMWIRVKNSMVYLHTSTTIFYTCGTNGSMNVKANFYRMIYSFRCLYLCTTAIVLNDLPKIKFKYLSSTLSFNEKKLWATHSLTLKYNLLLAFCKYMTDINREINFSQYISSHTHRH